MPPPTTMSAPQPLTSLPDISHAVVIIFSGTGTIKESLKDYGWFFDAEVQDDSVHAMVVDPRFGHGAVMDYIIELGGTVYVPPPESPP